MHTSFQLLSSQTIAHPASCAAVPQTKDNVFTTLVVSIQYQVVPESLYEVKGLASSGTKCAP